MMTGTSGRTAIGEALAFPAQVMLTQSFAFPLSSTLQMNNHLSTFVIPIRPKRECNYYENQCTKKPATQLLTLAFHLATTSRR